MFKYREGSSICAYEMGVLTPEASRQTADKQKYLLYWPRVNLRKLIEMYIKVSINF